MVAKISQIKTQYKYFYDYQSNSSMEELSNSHKFQFRTLRKDKQDNNIK